MKERTKWLCALVAALVAYFWKILFTRQFTLMWTGDDVNLGFAWFNFIVQHLKRGALPLWDPYTNAGHLFQAEMQTGAFYPLTWLLFLTPMSNSGLLSIHSYYYSYILAHLLAGFFMFLLAEELGLGGLAAMVTALMFSLNEMLLFSGWPHLVNSGIWLPLILFCVIRAIKRGRNRDGVLYSCVAGLSLGVAVLAGGLHVVIMQVFVVLSTAGFLAFHAKGHAVGSISRRSAFAWAAIVVMIVGAVSFTASAVQLLPTWEYTKVAVRFIGDNWPAMRPSQRIPYAALGDNLAPSGLLNLVFRPAPYGGELKPYFGLMPLILAMVGVWRNWHRPWVKYAAGLALLSFVYSLGRFSLLHGLTYALIPFIWMARESGRFIYLFHFAAAMLTGFGVQTLFTVAADNPLAPLLRLLKWVVVAMTAVLAFASLGKAPQLDEWMYLSCLLFFLTAGLFAYIARGHHGRATQFLLVALIVWDLSIFDWHVHNKIELGRGSGDQFENVLAARRLAEFFRSQSGLFRVRSEIPSFISLGSIYGIYTTDGFTASSTREFLDAWELPRANDLLNVQYVIRTGTATEPGPVYEDAQWKVYKTSTALPRAWLVHDVIVEPSAKALVARQKLPDFDPSRTAFVSSPLETSLEPASGGLEDVRFDDCCDTRLAMSVRTNSKALLILSEVYLPNWEATVNGTPVRICKVNGFLRGVVVPAGTSTVVFRYVPKAMYAGAALTLLTFAGTLMFALVIRYKRAQRRKAQAA